MSAIVYPSQFNTNNITIAAPKALPSGAKQAYVSYNDNKLVMQTAVEMIVPFGLNTYDKGPTPEYSINLSFRGQDQRPEIKEFMKALERLDEFMIDEGVKNATAWFRKPANREIISAFYTPCIKYSMDENGNRKDYPPNFKVKLPKRDGKWDTKFYDIKGNPYRDMTVEDLLVKNTSVTAIIECGGVWFAGGKFGLTWRAKQIAIHALQEKMGEFAFKGLEHAQASVVAAAKAAPQDDDMVDDEEVFHAPPKASAPQPVNDDDADDMEPIPAPTKTVVKKKIVIKK